MSASASKKKRQQLNEQGLNASQLAAANEKKERSKKLIPTLIFCGAAVLAVAAIVILALVSSKQKERILDEQYADHIGASTTTLATVGDVEFTAAMYNYYYYENKDSFDLSSANTSLAKMLNYYAAAKETGYTLPSEKAAEIDEQINTLRSSAQQNGWPKLDYYLSAQFGEGCNEANFREYLTIQQTASSYDSSVRENFMPEASEIEAEYNANVDDYDIVSYDLYTVKAPETEATEDDADKETEPDPETMRQLAEEAKANFPEDEAEDRSGTKNATVSSFDEEVAAWLFDASRKAGDVETFETVSGETTSYHVIRFNELNKNDYHPAVASIAYFFNTTDAEEGAPTLEEKVQEIISQATPDLSEEDFQALIGEQGYYNAPTEIAMYTLGKDATAFLYSENRAPGDIQYFDMGSNSILYLLRFQSVSEYTNLELTIKNKLLSSLIEEISTKYEMQINEAAYELTVMDAELYAPSDAE